jgi:hypothetical protein
MFLIYICKYEANLKTDASTEAFESSYRQRLDEKMLATWLSQLIMNLRIFRISMPAQQT